jgi:hypothetical protein
MESVPGEGSAGPIVCSHFWMTFAILQKNMLIGLPASIDNARFEGNQGG